MYPPAARITHSQYMYHYSVHISILTHREVFVVHTVLLTVHAGVLTPHLSELTMCVCVP